MLNQLQYCEENSIPLCVVLGTGELEQGVVKLRDVGTRWDYLLLLLHSMLVMLSMLLVFSPHLLFLLPLVMPVLYQGWGGCAKSRDGGGHQDKIEDQPSAGLNSALLRNGWNICWNPLKEFTYSILLICPPDSSEDCYHKTWNILVSIPIILDTKTFLDLAESLHIEFQVFWKFRLLYCTDYPVLSQFLPKWTFVVLYFNIVSLYFWMHGLLCSYRRHCMSIALNALYTNQIKGGQLSSVNNSFYVYRLAEAPASQNFPESWILEQTWPISWHQKLIFCWNIVLSKFQVLSKSEGNLYTWNLCHQN